jgi:hypothetical protein
MFLLLFAFVAMCSSSVSLNHWMEDFSDLLAPLTLWDISLPGAHDSMTATLSNVVADNANDLPSFLSALLHNVLDPNSVDAKWLRNQSVTQVLNMTQLLQNGVRFIDFRIVWTKGPDGSFNWFCLHMMQTRVSAMELLRELKSFLDAQPQEVVFLWITRHSDSCAGFDGSTIVEQQALFSQIQHLFGGVVFDHGRQRLNETTFSGMWKTNQRLIMAVAAWDTFANRSSLALDACASMDIWDPPDGVMQQIKTQDSQISQMLNSSALREQARMQNRVWATFWSTSTPTTQLISTALTTVFPSSPSEKAELMKACADSFNIPNSTFCPQTQLEVTSLSNYYLQKVLLFGINRGLQFPMVVYGDNIGSDGAQNVYEEQSFGFVHAIIVNSFQRYSQCGNRCSWLMDQLIEVSVNDPTLGRLKLWPPIQ